MPVYDLIIGILVVFSVILLIVVIYQSAVLINPNQCKSSFGNYGVFPSSEGSILNACGITKSEPCTFPTSNLTEAVNICTADPLCKFFTYDELTGLMYYNVNSTVTPSSDNFDVYAKQV